MFVTKTLATLALGYVAGANFRWLRQAMRDRDEEAVGRSLVFFCTPIILISAIWGI